MIQMVAGFLFSEDRKRVALIRKQHPEWQKDKLNGIGGKIEPCDKDMYDAIRREFKEETSVDNIMWNMYLSLEDIENGITVFFFRAFNDKALHDVKTMTDEEIEKIYVRDIVGYKTIPNLPWIVNLALDSSIYCPVTVMFNALLATGTKRLEDVR